MISVSLTCLNASIGCHKPRDAVAPLSNIGPRFNVQGVYSAVGTVGEEDLDLRSGGERYGFSSLNEA